MKTKMIAFSSAIALLLLFSLTGCTGSDTKKTPSVSDNSPGTIEDTGIPGCEDGYNIAKIPPSPTPTAPLITPLPVDRIREATPQIENTFQISEDTSKVQCNDPYTTCEDGYTCVNNVCVPIIPKLTPQDRIPRITIVDFYQ